MHGTGRGDGAPRLLAGRTAPNVLKSPSVRIRTASPIVGALMTFVRDSPAKDDTVEHQLPLTVTSGHVLVLALLAMSI